MYDVPLNPFFRIKGVVFQILQSCNRDAIGSFVATQALHCSHRITTELTMLQHLLEWQIAEN